MRACHRAATHQCVIITLVLALLNRLAYIVVLAKKALDDLKATRKHHLADGYGMSRPLSIVSDVIVLYCLWRVRFVENTR